jgi:YD repeat-containing protein
MFGMFGQGWRSTFEEVVFIADDGTTSYQRGDGSLWSLGWTNFTTDNEGVTQSSFQAISPASVRVSATTGAQNWTYTFENGEQRLFDNSTGKLTAIIDRNGNATSVTYDASGRLVTVTDPAGRHLYFGYQGSGYFVSTVTSDVGLSLSYSYDAQNRLVQVTKPDETTLSFEYAPGVLALISAVKDSSGKVLEAHTYDGRGRGLTSSRAGGVDAVTVTYPDPGILWIP